MYTGTAPGAIQYNCDLPANDSPQRAGGLRDRSQFQHIVALDRATIAFDAIGMSLVTYGGSIGAAPSYMPANSLVIPAKAWDAGDKGLPLEN